MAGPGERGQSQAYPPAIDWPGRVSPERADKVRFGASAGATSCAKPALGAAGLARQMGGPGPVPAPFLPVTVCRLTVSVATVASCTAR